MLTKEVIIEGIQVELALYDAILAIQSGSAIAVVVPSSDGLDPYGTTDSWLDGKTSITQLTRDGQDRLVSFYRGSELVTLYYDDANGGRLEFVRGSGWERELLYDGSGDLTDAILRKG